MCAFDKGETGPIWKAINSRAHVRKVRENCPGTAIQKAINAEED
jgi:hypothetical protein